RADRGDGDLHAALCFGADPARLSSRWYTGCICGADTMGKKRPALLVINSKSGPNDDSLLRLRGIVALLEEQGLGVEVRVKLRKKQARRDVREAVKRGCRLVIAAGGDGTVETAARAPAGTKAVPGTLPPGPHTNVHASLAVP